MNIRFGSYSLAFQMVWVNETVNRPNPIFSTNQLDRFKFIHSAARAATKNTKFRHEYIPAVNFSSCFHRFEKSFEKFYAVKLSLSLLNIFNIVNHLLPTEQGIAISTVRSYLSLCLEGLATFLVVKSLEFFL